MNGPGFDALTRTLSNVRSRRNLAQVLLGAGLGGMPVGVGLDEAEAKRGAARPQHRDHAQADKKKGKKKACPPCKKRKKGKCKGKLPDGAACPGGSCRAGNCQPCTPSCDGKVCGGENGCGGTCGACPAGQICRNGQCLRSCGGGLPTCSGNTICLDRACVPCDVCASGCPSRFLQAAIFGPADAEPKDTVVVCPGTYTFSQPIPLLSNMTVTIIGAGSDELGTILDGQNMTTPLEIYPGATLTLENLWITKGHTMYWNGGGLRNFGGDVTLVNVRVSDCFANYPGGGISHSSGLMTLIDCSIDHNDTSEFDGLGGGILNAGDMVVQGSAITHNTRWGIANSGTLTLRSGTVVSENDGYYSGGIFNFGTLSVQDSSVADNTTNSSCSGIYNSGPDSVLTLKAGSKVSGNTGGGGMCNEGKAELQAGSAVTGNTSAWSGGGIVNEGDLTLRDGSSVTGNSAQIGGGIYNTGAVTLQTGSSVTNNTAQTGGGIVNVPNPEYATVVTLATTDIVTGNHLLDGVTVSNCAPVDTIPNCIG